MVASNPVRMLRGLAPLLILSALMLLVLATQQPVSAQEVSAKLGVTRTIKSAILEEDRKVLVHVPASYDTSVNSYPVIYLLDGTEAYLLEMIAITNRLGNDRNAPEMIEEGAPSWVPLRR